MIFSNFRAKFKEYIEGNHPESVILALWQSAQEQWNDIKTAPKNTEVLICYDDGYVTCARFVTYRNKWIGGGGYEYVGVYAWMPLPNPKIRKNVNTQNIG